MQIFRVKNRKFELDKKPVLMGILNVTPDSFSDGNNFLSMDKALRQVEKMVFDGADIIDIGGESSRPGAAIVSTAEELDRIAEIVKIVHERFDLPISVDTYKGVVAKETLSLGAAMINDIFGLSKSPEIADFTAEAEAGLCLMHMRGNPGNMQNNTDYADILDEVSGFLESSLAIAIKRGVDKECICLDPGIGFGKSVAGNLRILNNVENFKSLGCPILIGTSRKSFIGNILNNEVADRLAGTIASNVIALERGARIFRVHDVKENREALDLAFQIING